MFNIKIFQLGLVIKSNSLIQILLKVLNKYFSKVGKKWIRIKFFEWIILIID
jgi:hypothetical protein